ncbi:MAG TPA: M15 family metallopeptidase [Candidatus Binatia bacterium]|nr:M15 family metallopeptidase [Candidatus Binatia bacterium]
MPTWPRQSECMHFYGSPGEHQTTLILPFPLKVAWDKTHIITKFSVHEKVHDSAKRCFDKIASAYDAAKRAEIGIDLWGGCLNVRKMRGGSSWSMHSWGIAIDFDPERNALKASSKTARLARPDCVEFWKIWESEGWVSLGRTRNFDWMHVQAARL